MEFRQLEIFRALAQELSFTRAAARVNCVQSNVTTQIRALEEELGAKLVDRLGRSVRLTDAGRRFLTHTERLLALAAEAREVAAGKGEPGGKLTIGASESVLTYRLPPFLHAFRKRYPQVQLLFEPLISNQMRDMLRSGVVDAVFLIDEPVKDPCFNSEVLFYEPMELFSMPAHPLVARRQVTATDLQPLTLLLTEPGCRYRVMLEQLLARERVIPSSVIGFSSVEAIKQCAALGMGVGFLPRMVVEPELRQRRLKALRWSGQEIRMVTQLVWHRDKWASPVFERFLDLVRATFVVRPTGATA